MQALLEGLQKPESRGGVLTSCEAELQELMRQIDIMVAHKKSEWESQTQALSAHLEFREQELSSAREMLEQRHREVGILQQQLADLENVKHSLAEEYEQQLGKVQEELSRLKRGYEKLQRKQLKEAQGEAKRKGEDRIEVSRLSRKIEEFRQKSLDWEQQRLVYHQQVSSLEAQRKAFIDQSELLKEQSQSYQSQFSSRKQMLEQIELVHRSEIQHLSSQIERAQDTIRVKELEAEQLSLRLEDSVVTNKKLVEEQQQAQEELTHVRKLLEVLKEEKEELKSTLQLQDDFLQSSRVQQEQIQKELARVNEALEAKELSIRSLEASLREKWVCKEGQEEMEQTLSQLDISRKSELSLRIVVSHLERRMQSTNTQCVHLKRELAETKEKLQLLLEQLGMYKSEAKMEGNVPLTVLRESYAKTLNNFEKANQHLLKDLSRTRAQLESVNHAHQDKYECVLQETPRRLSEIQNTEHRKTQELQQKPEEEINKLKARLENTIHHYECEVYALKAQHEYPVPAINHICSTTGGLAPNIRNSSTESFDISLRKKSFSLDLDGNEIDFSDDASINQSSSQQGKCLLMCSLSCSPIGSITTCFLEQEELRSQQLLERLDTHIEELRKESQKTLEHFSQTN